MNRIHRLQGIIWATIVITTLASSFASAFFMTSFLSARLGPNLPPLIIQILNSFLGLLVWLLIMSIISIFIRRKMGDPQTQVFGPITEAFEKIAKGDFNVRLTLDFGRIEPANKLAQSFNVMAEELSEMETMRQEFISNVSHEIQSPLTSILGFTRVLKNDQLNLEQRHHYLDIIETEGTRISRITDNLLRLAALESTQSVSELKPFRLDRQIRDLILACEPQWMDKDIEMDADLEEIEITADKDLFSQVWINLIHNSIKFTPHGGRIGIVLNKQNDCIKIKITDTGPGIGEEDQVHIFERFYKADKSRTKSDGGSGLGLSIARKIIEMHHGDIHVESKLGEGATFIVTLPSK
jgi:two-component system, OmpR family, phosphate regulon sensor histidine kinase PhoR